VALTILEGSTFCISDERGDFEAATTGLFANDTRFLSRWVLTVNRARPLLLSSAKVDYFSAAFYLRNPVAGGLGQDEVSIARERFVGEGMQEHVVVECHGHRPIELELALELGNDFADIFAVKHYDFALGDPARALPLPPPVPLVFDRADNEVVLRDSDGFPGLTQVFFSEVGELDGSSMRYRIALEPGQRWRLRVDVTVSPDGLETVPQRAERAFGDELARVRESLTSWHMRVPQLRTSWPALGAAFERSVADLASLRIARERGNGQLFAAGMPWFMAVFGRDTIITCLQTLLFGPELARGALTALAELQATEDEPEIDAQPGKIVHEVRSGKAVGTWFPRYYGTVDATPLFLVLLSEVWRWTDDAAFVRAFHDPAMKALAWIDDYADTTGDGFVDYVKRSPRGLDNQSWKDSYDSQLFHDGRQADPPIAPVEVQGYVYDAKRRVAQLAREVWRDRRLADRLEEEAADLRRRFDAAFWVEDERGGFYALALDREGRPVDSLTSNIGHLLWSGIVPPHRIDALVDRLMGPDLWSGWGVRTMSQADAGYSPLAYHNGTVWPHDNSLIAWGLASAGRWPEAQRIIRRIVEAAGHFNHQLPEVFAGFARGETPFPIAYPTAARPQAWAAATPVLLLQLLLGLAPDHRRQALESVAPAELPSWAGTLRLSGVRAFDRSWNVSLSDGRVQVDEAVSPHLAT
jgi:glycogen debranching enzyme